MKRLKLLLKIITSITLFVILALIIYVQQHKPIYDGTLNLELNQSAEVYFDDYGIPHIYAVNDDDAYKVLGYVHAQERLWQMELLRRITSGRLSEVFGEDMVKNDKFFKTLGIDRQTERILASEGIEQTNSFKYMRAYIEGINQFIAQGYTPLEYSILGLEKEPFRIADIYNITGYMAFSFAIAQKTDPLISYINRELGSAYLEDLMLDYDPKALVIKNEDHRSSNAIVAWSNYVEELIEPMPLPAFHGSNSWVVNKEKTSTGSVILANDPHIGYAQPAVWYEAHIKTPTYERYGYHLGGVPFPLLSHNKDYAFGLTMFENDDIDFYSEVQHAQNKDQYKTDKGWTNYITRDERIEVKGGDPVEFTVRETHHGPIINDVIPSLKGETPISMYWIYTQIDRNLMEVIYDLNNTDSIDEFEESLTDIHAPGLNVMYGDRFGNIAWWATAQLFNRLDSNHPKKIKEDVYDKEDHLQMIPFSDNPHAVNPQSGYVYSANNASKTMDKVLVPGYYAPDNRAQRIVKLLEPKDDWNVESIAAMMIDDTSEVVPTSIKHLTESIDRSKLSEEQLELLDQLSNWNGAYSLDSHLPTLYHQWEEAFISYCFEDELGAETTQNLMNIHLSKKFIAPLIAKETSVWFDRVDTDLKEDKTAVVTNSFLNAYTILTQDLGPDFNSWQWAHVHQLEHQHPLGRVALLRKLFNVGPNPIAGARDVINAVNFRYDLKEDKFPANAGPSTRRVVDFSNIDNSVSVLPTGQSGNPLSPHYDDQVVLYNQGTYRPMLMNEVKIKAESKNVLHID